MSVPVSENIAGVIQNLAEAIVKKACRKEGVAYEGLTTSVIRRHYQKLSKHLSPSQIDGLSLVKKHRVLESYGDAPRKTLRSESTSDSDKIYSDCKECRLESPPRKLSTSVSSLNDEEIDERVENIRNHLHALSSEEQPQNERYRKVPLVEFSDEDVRKALEWDLPCSPCRGCPSPQGPCQSSSHSCPKPPPPCKPCHDRCGEFVIDEDIQEFKRKVIRKAEVIIGCYKKQLEECKKSRKALEESLKCCQKKNQALICKLKDCHHKLEKCQEEKCLIIKKAKKCSEQLHELLRRYERLEEEYRKKKAELEKCRGRNAHLEKEVAELKARLKHCCLEKKHLKEQVDKLFEALECCKREKHHLRQLVQALKEKLERCQKKICKQERVIRELQEEIDRLKQKVKMLLCQNEELTRENADLRKQLGRTLRTLKCLCDKYDALKEKCKHCKC